MKRGSSEGPIDLIEPQNVLSVRNMTIYSAKLTFVLNKLSAKLTKDDLIALCDRIEGSEKAQASIVLRQRLTKEGLLT